MPAGLDESWGGGAWCRFRERRLESPEANDLPTLASAPVAITARTHHLDAIRTDSNYVEPALALTGNT